MRLVPSRRLARAFALVIVAALLIVPGLGISQGNVREMRAHEPVLIRALAVSSPSNGVSQGTVATISVTLIEGGSGHVFLDTMPLTQVDMQGSTRLATRVAGAITGMAYNKFDYIFVFRAPAEFIGGPSAGAVATVATVVAMQNTRASQEPWRIREDVLMTGTVTPDGGVGPVGGVPEKAAAAAEFGAAVFMFPPGQELGRTRNGVLNLTNHCANDLGITCLPVASIEQAVEVYTGHRFEHPPSDGPVADEPYRSAMEPLATELLEASRNLLAGARANLTRNGPDLPESVLAALQQSLEQSAENVRIAGESFNATGYYTAASKSFQASIDARYVEFALAYLAARAEGREGRGLDDLFEKTRAHVDAARSTAREARPTSVSQLQAVGAAQSRAREAVAYLSDAQSTRADARTTGEMLGAVRSLALAYERASTAPWWVRIGETFKGNATFDPAVSAAMAQETLAISEEIIAYDEAILASAGIVADPDWEARAKLKAARALAADGLYAAAVFDALEAQVRASLTVELMTYGKENVPAQKVAHARREAERAILAARGHGLEPILAVSYYEFAQSWPTDDNRLLFFSLARVIARNGQILAQGSDDAPTPSRFVGHAEFPAPRPRSADVSSAALGLTLAGLAVGGALGLGVGVLAGRRREPDAARTVTLQPASPTPEPMHRTLLPTDASRPEQVPERATLTQSTTPDPHERTP